MAVRKAKRWHWQTCDYIWITYQLHEPISVNVWTNSLRAFGSETCGWDAGGTPPSHLSLFVYCPCASPRFFFEMPVAQSSPQSSQTEHIPSYLGLGCYFVSQRSEPLDDKSMDIMLDGGTLCWLFLTEPRVSTLDGACIKLFLSVWEIECSFYFLESESYQFWLSTRACSASKLMSFASVHKWKVSVFLSCTVSGLMLLVPSGFTWASIRVAATACT